MLSFNKYFSYNENVETDDANEVIYALEALILSLTFDYEKKHSEHLKLALKCVIKLCGAKQEHCETFVDLLGTRLDNVESKFVTTE